MFRIQRKSKNEVYPIYINWFTVHRLFATALLLAQKNEGRPVTNTHNHAFLMSLQGHLSSFFFIFCLQRNDHCDYTELNALEQEFLIIIDFELHITREQVCCHASSWCLQSDNDHGNHCLVDGI